MAEVIVLFDGYSKQLESDPTRMDANCTCTLIKGPKLIVVDTMTAWDRENLVQALADHDVQPADIDYVVCTHSHADHTGNNNLFTNAEHIVGISVQRGTIFYTKGIEAEDYELCEGVKITFTPGHTDEDVTVLVDTAIGGKRTTYAVAGDLFEKEEDILDSSLWKSVGHGSKHATQAKNRSRVMNLTDYIIPGHGPMFKVTEAMRETLDYQTICETSDGG